MRLMLEAHELQKFALYYFSFLMTISADQQKHCRDSKLRFNK